MFWRGIFGYLPVAFVQAATGILTMVVFTRLLSPALYGAYVLGFSAGSLVQVCLLSWTEASTVRFWAIRQRDGQLSDHFATLYRLWGLSAAAVPLAILVVLALPLGKSLETALIAALVSCLANSVAKLALDKRRAAGETTKVAMLSVFQSAGGFLLGVGLVKLGLGGAAPLLGVGCASLVICLLVLPTEISSMSGGKFTPSFALEYANYGLPVSASLIMATVLSSADRLILGSMLGESVVGAYHAGYALGNRTLEVLFIWLNMAGAPALVAALERGGKAALNAAAKEQASLLILITLPAAVGLILVSRPLVEVMVGPALRADAVRVTPWIAASGWLSGVTTYYLMQAFGLARRTKLLVLTMAIPAVLNIVLNVALIPIFGLEGALQATTASYAVGLAAAWFFGRWACPLPFPIDVLLKVGLASLVMALCVRQIPAIGGFGELSVKAAVGALVYGALALTFDIGGFRSRAVNLLRKAPETERP